MKKNVLTIIFGLSFALAASSLSAENNKMKWQRIGYIWEGLNAQSLPLAKLQHAQELLNQLIQEEIDKWRSKNPEKAKAFRCTQSPCINPEYPQSLQILIKALAIIQKDKTEGRKYAAQMLKNELKRHAERIEQRKKQREKDRFKPGTTANLNILLAGQVRNVDEDLASKIPASVKRKTIPGGATVYALPNSGQYVQALTWLQNETIPKHIRRRINKDGTISYISLKDGTFVTPQEWLEHNTK